MAAIHKVRRTFPTDLTHALVGVELLHRLAQLVLDSGIARRQLCDGGGGGLDLSIVELVTAGRYPCFGVFAGGAKDEFADVGQMLTRVIEIDNVNCGGEVLLSQVQDPERGGAEDNHLGSTVEPPPHCLGADAWTELPHRLDRAHIGGRLRIADGSSVIVAGRLSEHTRELGFPFLSDSLPERPWVCFGTAGTPVASMATYRRRAAAMGCTLPAAGAVRP